MAIKYYQNRYFDYYARHTYLVVLAILKDPSMHYIEEPLTMKREAILDWK